MACDSCHPWSRIARSKSSWSQAPWSWTQIGRSVDASTFSFASKNKSMNHMHLTARSAIFGRIGRKFPEHFIGEGAPCRRDQVSRSQWSKRRKRLAVAPGRVWQTDSRSNSKNVRTQNGLVGRKADANPDAKCRRDNRRKLLFAHYLPATCDERRTHMTQNNTGPQRTRPQV